MLSEVSCSISPGCHREVKQKCGQNWSNGSRFEVGSSLHLVYAWSIRMPSAATKKSKTLTQTDILDSQCISSSHLKLFLVFSWWQNIWSSFWHYMLYVHYWQDMRVCFRISLSSEWRIYFPRSLQSKPGHMSIPKPAPLARQCHWLNTGGLSSWTTCKEWSYH